MLEFKKILFPIDFSDRCRGAARYVEALAGQSGSKVILLNVLESTIGQPGDLVFGGVATSLHWEDRTARAQEALDRFLSDELSDIEVERRLEAGDPARTIVRVAHEENVDLIMMPTHGYGGFRRFVLGSVTAKVLHDAQCPVWTGVHMEDAPALDAIAIRNIVCALDLTDNSKPAFAAAVELARRYGAQLTLTHAVPGSEALPEKLMDMELRQHLVRQARLQLEAQCAEAGVKARVCIDVGDVHKIVSACTEAHKAELLVIGRGHHNGFGRLRAHSYSIIRESPCPVISI
jgi:nucleotide-binding universal stress UspA family protein